MGFLERVRFKFFDAGKMVSSLIEDWRPRKCKTEKDYEKSLYLFLHERLEDTNITKQYAKGRIRADLVVGDKVIIELKNNLNTTAKYQKLIGQLAEYEEWGGQIIVVLKGDTDANLYKELMKRAAEEEDEDEEARITVIQK